MKINLRDKGETRRFSLSALRLPSPARHTHSGFVHYTVPDEKKGTTCTLKLRFVKRQLCTRITLLVHFAKTGNFLISRFMEQDDKFVSFFLNLTLSNLDATVEF